MELLNLVVLFATSWVAKMLPYREKLDLDPQIKLAQYCANLQSQYLAGRAQRTQEKFEQDKEEFLKLAAKRIREAKVIFNKHDASCKYYIEQYLTYLNAAGLQSSIEYHRNQEQYEIKVRW